MTSPQGAPREAGRHTPLPCRCGLTPVLTRTENDGTEGHWFVACDCGYDSPIHWNRMKALGIWNRIRRAALAALTPHPTPKDPQ